MDLSERIQQEYQDQTPDEVKLASHVKEKVEESRSSATRTANEAIWMTNIAYLMGITGVNYSTVTRSFQPVNRPYAGSNNRKQVNKILPSVQTRLAKLCKNPPKWDVKPESNSTDDKEAARLGLQVLMAMWENLRLDQKRFSAVMWAQQCGHGWVKVAWDETLGKAMVDPITGELAYEGDVRADVCSPFEIFPDPMAKNDEDVLSSWLIQAKVRKLDYFTLHYPEKGHLVKEEGAWLMSSQYEQRINTMTNRWGGGSGSSAEATKNTAIELVKYEARSKKHPNGRMIVVANGIVLADKELPCGEIPFAKFDDITIAGRFYPEAIITHLRPIQDQYDELISRRAEWVRTLLAGKYIAPKGHGLSQESLNDRTEFLQYTPNPTAPDGGKPTKVDIPTIPQYAYTEQDKLDGFFNDISGIQEIDKGNVPSAGIPYAGMQLMTENSDTRTAITTEQHEHAWARIGSLILKYVEKFYVMPRKLKIAGSDLQYCVKDISGEDLKGNTDVHVVRGSTLPGSKALKRQEILNTYQQGLLGDPMDPKVREKVLGLIEFGDVQGIWEDYGLDEAQIKRVIESLEQGIPVDVSEFDNHALWLQELNRYRKGDKFASLDPMIQQLFLDTMENCVQQTMNMSGAIPPEPLPPEMQPESVMPVMPDQPPPMEGV